MYLKGVQKRVVPSSASNWTRMPGKYSYYSISNAKIPTFNDNIDAESKKRREEVNSEHLM